MIHPNQITVIMASHLGEYEGCAKQREYKFVRAVNSFIAQNSSKLIIVSDGCERTTSLYYNCYHSFNNIKLIEIEKQTFFSGKVRQVALEQVTTDWVCYLDSDDEFLSGHLSKLASAIDPKYDWMWYDDIHPSGFMIGRAVRYGNIGTPNITHKSTTTAIWPDGRGHDWRFIEQLGQNYSKIPTQLGYKLNHIPNIFDY